MVKNKKGKITGHVKQNGLRKGIDKKMIIDSLSDEDWQRLELQKSLKDTYIKSPLAFQCATRIDQVFQQYDAKLSEIEKVMFDLLSSQNIVDKNKQTMLRDDITLTFPGTQILMTKRDLEIENLLMSKKIGDCRRMLWVHLANLYLYIGVHRLDKKIFLTLEQYTKYTNDLVDCLKKAGIDLFKERL